MAQYYDCYFLVKSRTEIYIRNFLDQYLPLRVESALDYPIPQYTDEKSIIFNTDTELMNYLEINKDIEYSIYWRSLDNESPIKHGMALYTDDKKLILGISVIYTISRDLLSTIFSNIEKSLLSDSACITIEEIPPLNSEQFVEFCAYRNT